MGFFLERNDYEISLALLLMCWSAIYFHVTKNYNYWKHKSVPYVEPCFPFGSTKDMIFGNKSIGEMYEYFYKQFGSQPFFGVLKETTPVFVVKDPDLIKIILTRDFNHFEDRTSLVPAHSRKDYLFQNLSNLEGKEWKSMRRKITPTFSSQKLKLMFLLMKKCNEQLKEYVKNRVNTNSKINVKDTMGRFTLDIIATCAFGLDINSLSEKESEFYKICNEITKQVTITKIVKTVLYFNFPFLKHIYETTFISENITQFVTKVVRDTIKHREQNNVNRNDFLDLLIKISNNQSLLDEDDLVNELGLSNKDKTTENEGLTIEEMSAQTFFFLAAGFETTSSTITFCLYELARHPEVQERLYQEIRDVQEKHDNDLSYEALMKMTYLDQVVNETLRRYGSLPTLRRTCTQTYTVPGTDIVLERGQQVIVPIYALHHDPKYYPDPHKFDPERFTPDKVKERHPYVHLPFGEGPRKCIGSRFGLLETKLGLTGMVSNFVLSLSSETEVPLTINKILPLTMPKNPVILQLTRR